MAFDLATICTPLVRGALRADPEKESAAIVQAAIMVDEE
jgi:hypothetical protein